MSARLSKILALVLALSLHPAQLNAQVTGDQERQIVDRVAAVVGDSIVLLTQIQERILQMGASGMQVPPRGSPAFLEMQDEVLQTLVNEQLLIQAALRDTLIVVEEDRIEGMVQEEWEGRTGQFPGGETAFVAELQRNGFTSASYREFLASQFRKQQLQSQLIQRRAQSSRAVTISEDEIQAFFQQQAGQLPERPATITLKQVILQPSPAAEAKDSALALATRVRNMFLVEEEDFEDLARRFSDDPGSQRNGGDLGWFRRGSGFVREFEDAAFALFPGQVSEPVETVFGYHLILVERIRGPERKARHILVSFDITPDDVAATRVLGGDVRSRVEAGEDLQDIADELGDRVAMYDSATVATTQLSNFPPALSGPLQVATAGSVVGPVDVGGRPGVPNFAVVEVLEVREAGVATVEDLRDQIEGRLRQEKILEIILAELRETTYVSIKL
jgi:peptidyl-prolyl cis-trans isomerase SurA